MNKSFFKVIDSVIVFNCKILNLEQPTVTYEPPNKFATPTTKAGINPDKNVIAINIDTVWESPVEIWWVISHEMRHLWQVKNGQFNVDNYNPSQENNLKSYAMQFEEVDANAWGCICDNFVISHTPLVGKYLRRTGVATDLEEG